MIKTQSRPQTEKIKLDRAAITLKMLLNFW